jgi:hypothetical protein
MVRRAVILACAVAVAVLLPSAASAGDDKASGNVLEKQAGDVKSVCAHDTKSGNLICALVYAKQPYFGIQFGSEDDADSVAVTAGIRRVANSEIEIRIDDDVPHIVYGDGFVGKEAQAIVDEIKKGKWTYVRADSYDSSVKSEDTIDLTDFKSALQEIEVLRKSQVTQ